MQRVEFLTRAMEILSRLSDDELSSLRAAIGAELLERDLNGKKQDKGWGKPSGANTPAPAAHQILAVLREKAKAMSHPNTFALALEYERRTGKAATAALEKQVLRPMVFEELRRRGEL